MINHFSPLHEVKRRPILDLLRGTAGFLMILAHSLFFFHDGSVVALNALARFGNTVVFTLFLFVSGASLYEAYIRPTDQQRKNTLSIAKRTAYLLFGYYIVAFVAVFEKIARFDAASIKNTIINVLFFIKIPAFSEFILPFIIFSLSILLLKPLYTKITKHYSIAIFVSLVIFIVAYALYPIQASGNIKLLKAVFIGEEGLLRFPILMYFPVFIFGMYWGKILDTSKNESTLRALAFMVGIMLLGVTLVAFLLSNIFPVNFIDPLNRWPPSFGFLTAGLSFALLTYLFYSLFLARRFMRVIVRCVDYLGQDAFDLYIVHIIILFLYRYTVGVKFDNPFIVLLLFTGILILSVFFSSLNWKISPSFFTLGHITFGKRYGLRVKKRYIFAVIFLNILLFSQINLFVSTTNTGGIIKKEEIIGIENAPIFTQPPSWYNQEYGYYRQLTLKNEDIFGPIRKGEWVLYTIDHKTKVDGKKSRPSGDDLLLAYYKDGGYTSIPVIIQSPNTSATTISLKVENDIFPNTFDNRYFLYYGSDFPIKQNEAPSPIIHTAVKYAFSTSEEYKQKLSLSLNRKWFLKSAPAKLYAKSVFLIPIVEDASVNNPRDNHAEYFVEIKNDVFAKQIALTAKENVEQTIDMQLFPAGEYEIAAYKKTAEIAVASRRQKVFVSEPLYIGISPDWEGWEVPRDTLDSFTNLLTLYGNPPITHFFNPRIYLPTVVSPEYASFLTDWILERKQSVGDDIALHLHMHFDVLEVVGIAPKKNPRWGYRSEEGYDVLSTAYSYDAFVRLLTWSKDQFKTHGLPESVGYRAGGWFMNSELLKALQDSGFLYDSSGRDREMWGGIYTSPWDLTSLSQPYYPAENDQNVSSDNRLSLLEIPNNGGNTFEHSAPQLTARFFDNYSENTLSQKKAVVFMDHPQWFTIYMKKISDLLGTVDKYSFTKDAGPVLYVTLQTIYELWK